MPELPERQRPMVEPDLHPDAPELDLGPDVEAPLLTRLNRRGFRLVMLLDTVLLYTASIAIMLVRFGTEWPTFPVPTYLASFAIAVAIFIASLYFGGMYEREPRLGAPPSLPRAARQTLAAGGLVALLTLALTGAAREFGLTTARALPFPILNLAIFIGLSAILVSFNRALVHRVRTRREGPPKVVLAGDEHDREIARSHLAVEGGRIQVDLRGGRPRGAARRGGQVGRDGRRRRVGRVARRPLPRRRRVPRPGQRDVLLRVTAPRDDVRPGAAPGGRGAAVRAAAAADDAALPDELQAPVRPHRAGGDRTCLAAAPRGDGAPTSGSWPAARCCSGRSGSGPRAGCSRW
jgi:hypothetical protein